MDEADSAMPHESPQPFGDLLSDIRVPSSVQVDIEQFLRNEMSMSQEIVQFQLQAHNLRLPTSPSEMATVDAYTVRSYAETSPSLCFGSEGTRSSTVTSTSVARSFHPNQPRLADPEEWNAHYEESAVQHNDTPFVRYPCIFHFMCDKTSHEDDWLEHTLSHFYPRGPRAAARPIPNTMICPICPDAKVRFTDVNPCQAWAKGLMHIGLHIRVPQSNFPKLAQTTPDLDLINHLWHGGLISEAQYKVLRTDARGDVALSPYTETERSFRDRDRRNHLAALRRNWPAE